MKSKPNHSNSKHNLDKSLDQIRNKRKEYAKLQAMEKLRPDRAVADLVKPRNNALVHFTNDIAHRVTQRLAMTLLTSDNSNDKHTNINPDDSDDYTRMDILLRADRRDADGDENAQNLAAKPNYKDVVAVIEVKHLTNEEAQAFAQLIIYSCNLYANQHNRRFVWGSTICGSHVRACVLTSNNIFGPAVMDVNKHKDRQEFVSLLVNMSYCAEDQHQLGYDSTIRLDDRGNIDKIDVYVEDADRIVPYKIVAMAAIATRRFGRHTRCYLCKSAAASAQPDGSNSSADDGYITRCAKDGSEKAESENARRNEALLMRRIAKGLEGIASVDGKYAKLIHGGTVGFEKDSGGATEKNNIDTAFGAVFSSDLKEKQQPKFRIHQCLTMTPWCRPLQNVANVEQLIVAMADVMEAHTAIFKECRILHRDISLNNMIF
ncbi:hypothetical protein IWW48_005491 [Coemansia sp. RSA 1200]|nr:hypothetical protein IWW48_005491 [Coemansia sp. RSA 1200]